MTVFTFHFATTSIGTVLRALCRPPTEQQVPGLNHAECMTWFGGIAACPDLSVTLLPWPSAGARFSTSSSRLFDSGLSQSMGIGRGGPISSHLEKPSFLFKHCLIRKPLAQTLADYAH